MDAKVAPIKPENAVPVDETDAATARDLLAGIAAWQHALGEVREAYLINEAALFERIVAARAEYEQHVKAMARRNVKTLEGDYRYVPELGAFVGAQS